MIVLLPFPSASLMPNRRLGKHWTATSAAKSAQADDAYYLTRAAIAAQGWQAPEGRIALSLLYLQPDKRHRDLDNLLAASKALLDGMARALEVDDSRFRPILVDDAPGPSCGALVAAIGVQIVSAAQLVGAE